jgi:hypothetical protein
MAGNREAVNCVRGAARGCASGRASRSLIPILSLAALVLARADQLSAQVPKYPPGEHFSRNVRLLSHIPLADTLKVADIELEQDLSRPYAYVSRMRGPHGFQIIELKDPAKPKLLHSWFIENTELHQGAGGLKGMYFKLKGRYFYAQSFQFQRGSVNADLVAVIFDVTGLPDVAKIREVGRIRTPETPGGAHNMFAYKHSDGRVLLFTTVEATPEIPYGANIYDMEKFLAGDPAQGLAGHVPLPEPRGANRGYHDAYAAYDPVTKQDKFYGGGPETTPLGGNYVYDITDTSNPKLLASIIANPSLQSGGHTFVPTPDGRYALTVMTSPAHQPVRFWDLKPALDGKQPVITTPIGEWTPDPTKSVHMIEIRWPYAFVAAYQDGMQVVDIRDPTMPYTVGFYDTWARPRKYQGGGVAQGAFGIDVRNADGLIVVSDDYSGFWAFKMDGFDGWNGRLWGQPNSSSVQDWDNGPDGAPKPKPVT